VQKPLETTQEKDISTDAPSSAELSESLTQQGDKSDKRGEEGLLSLLAPPHIRNSENHVLRQGCREKDISTQGRPWLEALGSLEERALKEEKKNTNTVLSSVEEILESPVQRGVKSDRSPTHSPDGEGTSDVNTTEVRPKEAQRTLVTTQDQLSGVVADLEGADLVALDLETTGLNPRKDSIRLLSLATKDAIYILDCQSVNPTELFLILAQANIRASEGRAFIIANSPR
jgi:hypothetical protein